LGHWHYGAGAPTAFGGTARGIISVVRFRERHDTSPGGYVSDFLSKLGTTLLTVVIAVGGSAAIWVGANLALNQIKRSWAAFSLMIYAAGGFFVGVLISGNQLTKYSSPSGGWFVNFGYWVWLPLVLAAGAAVTGWAIARATGTQRMIVGAAGFGILGAIVGVLLRSKAHPEIEPVALIACTVVLAGVGAGIGVLRKRPPVRGALTGAAFGWLIGAFGAPDLTGSAGWAIVACIVPTALLGARLGITDAPDQAGQSAADQRGRAIVFLAPALLFIFGALVVPTIRTVYLSFFDDDSEDWVGFDNYQSIFTNEESLDLSAWTDIFTSWLFRIGLVILVLFVVLAVKGRRQTGRTVELGSPSMFPLLAGGMLLAFAVFTVLRGTIINNLWWVVVVTFFSTGLGLAIAVLADGAKLERTAKSLIFMPMALSLVGASVIWRFMYVSRDASKEQTGVLNGLWVGLGRLSTDQSPAPTVVVALLIVGAIAAFIRFLVTGKFIAAGVTLIASPVLIWAVYAAWNGLSGAALKVLLGLLIALVWVGLLALMGRALVTRRYGAATAPGVAALLLGWFLWRYWAITGGGVGGQRTNSGGRLIGDTIDFIQERPFNNFWLMVVLIWIQTGFSMVILSAAIKAVPSELLEAARVDGATGQQVFWRVTLPQIATTIGVVVTTLIVLVMKVFDIVKVMTNGQLGTEVLANNMYREAFSNTNRGLGAALAVLIFVSVLPIMFMNIRRMQREG
jgi:ABC-type sugar transport system permease subunit